MKIHVKRRIVILEAQRFRADMSVILMLRIELNYYYQYYGLTLLPEATLILLLMYILISTPKISCQMLPKIIYALNCSLSATSCKLCQ